MFIFFKVKSNLSNVLSFVNVSGTKFQFIAGCSKLFDLNVLNFFELITKDYIKFANKFTDLNHYHFNTFFTVDLSFLMHERFPLFVPKRSWVLTWRFLTVLWVIRPSSNLNGLKTFMKTARKGEHDNPLNKRFGLGNTSKNAVNKKLILK